MLDIAFIRENKEVVKKSAEAKGFAVDLDKLLEHDGKRRELLGEVEKLREQRNKLAGRQGKPGAADIETGKKLKQELAGQEAELDKAQQALWELLEQVPNVMPDDTPVGDESQNRVEREWGDKAKKDFEVLDHLKWATQGGLIDFERGAKVAGNKFYYLKGALVELEYALFTYVLKKSVKEGYVPLAVPHLVNSKVAAGTGFMPRGEEKQIYKIEDEDLHLIATAEMPLTAYHAGEILAGTVLPRMYVGISPSYRREAGAYGKHSRGLFRVHQFDKAELYVFCEPKDSEQWHQKLLKFEEDLCQELEIPYRVVRSASAELGAPAYKKYDVEYWSPAENTYRELMSCSNVTDYQSRRLNIRYRNASGETGLLHTLNATAMAFSRVAIALIENYQQSDGSVVIPKVLHGLMGSKVIKP